jgi:hypothetical protein
MKDGAIVVLMFLLLLSLFAYSYNQKEVKYDCRMLIGGWHPDFPAKVIEDCRNITKDNT